MAARIEYIPLDDLASMRWHDVTGKENPKDHDIEAIKGSIATKGFWDPLIFDERTGAIVSGHGRLEAVQMLREEGADLPKNMDDWALPVLRGLAFESVEEAQEYVIAANALTMAGGWRKQALAESLAELQAKGRSMEFVGLKREAIQEMIDNLGAKDRIPPKDFQEVGMDVTVDYKCPKCSYEWSGKTS